MKKKIYWKDIRKSFSGSKGRFLSILCLMMLGSLALVGLKVTTPNMQRTAAHYLRQQRTMDLAVMADYGLDQADQDELRAVKGAEVEFGYLADVTVQGKDQALRVFSRTDKISTFELTQGRLPKTDQEIALASFWADQYQVGQEIHLEKKEGSSSVLKHKTYKIVGFVHSAELLSDQNLGSANSGSGTLDAYAVLDPSAFESDVYSLARLRYQDLAELDPFSASYQERLDQHQEDLDKQLKDNGSARLEVLTKEGQQSVEEGQSKLDQATAELTEGREQIQAAQSQLDAQKSQLDQALASGLLPSQRASQSQADLQTAQSQLDQKKQDLARAESDLKTSRGQLADAKQALADLTEPVYHSYSRKSLPGGQGYLMYRNAGSSITAIGNIFPLVLYLVAAMVAFTTMTRFVDEERTNAGIFKALGYHSRDIIRKFVVYGLVAGSLGTLIGILLGHYVLSVVIAQTITRGMVVGPSKSYFYLSYSLMAFALSLVSSVLPAYLVARRELTEEAAHLLLPKPPVKGSKILLERLGFVWKRLSFTHKVTARNIFRYKQRMLMTIFGVAGSVALLFAGLGIQSSIGGVAQRQFEELLQYDLIVIAHDSASQEEQAELDKKLDSQAVSGYEKIYTETFDQRYQGSKDTETVTLMVTDKDNLRPFIQLDSQTDQSRLSLKEGAVISSKLAQIAGVSIGDQLELDGKKITVAAINENYVGHFVYMNQTDYEQVFGKKIEKNAYLVKLRNSSSQQTVQAASDFMHLKAVQHVSQNASMVRQFNTLADSLNSTMLILVIVSILLAMVILYNLTNINVAERIRELSTIKVLGFHNKEVTLYIYRETILLSLIGIGSGLLGGFYLHRFLIQMIAPSFIAFNPQVSWEVYLLPTLAVSLILTFLGFFVNYRLRRVDMLEALKSVD